MKYSTLLFLLNIFLFYSCLDSRIEINDPTRAFRIQRSMNFDSLETGQLIRFAGFIIDDIYTEDQITARYSGDTLELEVISTENGIIEIKESLTRCSNFFFSEDFYPYIGANQQGTNSWQIQNDTLRPANMVLEGRNCITWSPLIHTCSLPFAETSDEINLMDESDYSLIRNYDRCASGYCELLQFQLLGKSYDNLLIKKDSEYTYSDGPGSITYYSKEHGVVRVIHYFGDLAQAYGWDRIWNPIPFPSQDSCPQEKDAVEG